MDERIPQMFEKQSYIKQASECFGVICRFVTLRKMQFGLFFAFACFGHNSASCAFFVAFQGKCYGTSTRISVAIWLCTFESAPALPLRSHPAHLYCILFRRHCVSSVLCDAPPSGGTCKNQNCTEKLYCVRKGSIHSHH